MTNDGAAAATPRWLISLFVTALGLWVGAAAFVSAGVLPVLFLNLETAEAGRIAALIFPVYFRASLVVGVIASAAALAISRSAGRAWLYAFAVLVVMTLAQAWTTLSIHPEMAQIRGVDSSRPFPGVAQAFSTAEQRRARRRGAAASFERLAARRSRRAPRCLKR